jgi:metal-responsive CopG/Arc/MetJ family transcriptional regulator
LIEKTSTSSRSAFINDAVRYYASRLERANLKKRLKSRYVTYAEDDREVVKNLKDKTKRPGN